MVIGVASVGWIGYTGKAPGTRGSIAGAAFYGLLLYPLPGVWQWSIAMVLLIIATAFCDEAERRLSARDPGQIVADEFAAMPFVFLGLDPHLNAVQLSTVLLAGFLLFRIFDIVKPLGIRRLQLLPGGLGVMADDVAAALVSCGLLHLMIFAAQRSAWM